MVHQHFMLIPTFTVTEKRYPGPGAVQAGLCGQGRGRSGSWEKLSAQYGLEVDPSARVETLSVGLQQRIEIIKVLFRGARILILDEPTAVLAPQEVEEFFRILRSLKSQGKTIIFITHKLREVMAVSDRVTVMRRGRVVGSVVTGESSTDEIATLMVGRRVLFRVERRPAHPGRAVLEVSGLEARDNKNLPALRRVSLAVREGEILGVAGVEGNGQSELVEVLTGLRRATAGRIVLDKVDITNSSPRNIRGERLGPHSGGPAPAGAGSGIQPGPEHRAGRPLPQTVHQTLYFSGNEPPAHKGQGRQADPGVRHQAAGPGQPGRESLRRQPAKAGRGPGAGPGPQASDRGPAHQGR